MIRTRKKTEGEGKAVKTSGEYHFDPAQPQAVPEMLLPTLNAHGVKKEDVRLLIRADYDDGYRYADRFLILTGNELLTVDGLRVRGGSDVYIEKSVARRPLAGLSEMKAEDLASSCILTVKTGNGEEGEAGRAVLTTFSRTYREDFEQFCEYANELFEKGEFTPADADKNRKKELYCPTCGLRYVDPDSKFCPKCRKKGGVILRTFGLFREYRLKLFFVLISLVAGAALAIVAPYLSAGFLYDNVLSNEGNPYYGKLLLLIGAILLTRVLSMFVSSTHSILTSRLAADMTYKLRKVIFSSINRLSLSFFTSRKTGGLMTQVDHDAQTIYWFFCDELPQFAVSAVQVIAVTVIMFLINPLLALAAVLFMPPAILLVYHVFRKEEVLFQRRFGRRRSMNSTVSDMLGGVRVVKAFSGEKNEKKRFEGKSEALAAADRRVGYFDARSFPFIMLLLRLGSVAVWAVGGVMILMNYTSPGLISRDTVLTYGMLATFLSYVSMVYEPMFSFADTIILAADSINAMGRLIEIMDAKPEVVEKEDAVDLPDMKGELRFEGVHFSYTPGVTVLENVGFDVKAGSTVGIVGKTGAGKTTLANLLARLYDPTKGKILIDGVDLRDLKIETLRRNISIVSQDTYLFSGTILENVRYARPEASLEEVFAACAAAGAEEFIMKLRDGYDTRIGQGYADLSGGERQRLSIARAILKNPKILILDEATASMDTRTEQIVQNTLSSFYAGRTTVMIAHRLSTLRDADELIVLDGKTVAERGSPTELIKEKGVYYSLYKLQVEALKNVGVAEEGDEG